MTKTLFVGTVLAALTLLVLAAVPVEFRLAALVPVFLAWCVGARLAERGLR